jgi:hypothetical protein
MAEPDLERLDDEGGEHLPASVISRLAGSGVPLLPGESLADYRIGLAKTINELDATTHLQVYLAEKIFNCLWWIRRLETQKTAIITNKMVERLSRYSGDIDVRALIEGQHWEHKQLKIVLAAAKESMQSLIAGAFRMERPVLQSLDQQIADQIKALKGLQQSYEALVNRAVMIERLHLQNALLKRDLDAIDMDPAVAILEPLDDSKPQAKRKKGR